MRHMKVTARFDKNHTFLVYRSLYYDMVQVFIRLVLVEEDVPVPIRECDRRLVSCFNLATPQAPTKEGDERVATKRKYQDPLIWKNRSKKNGMH